MSCTPSSSIVPEDLDATRWENLEPLYRGLLDRKLNCPNCLKGLILDRSELDAATSESASEVEGPGATRPRPSKVSGPGAAACRSPRQTAKPSMATPTAAAPAIRQSRVTAPA